jgi:hypothetical protein
VYHANGTRMQSSDVTANCLVNFAQIDEIGHLCSATLFQIKSPACGGLEPQAWPVVVHIVEAPAAAPPIGSYHRLRTEQSPMPQILRLSQYRSEDVIPKGCANAVVSRREFMMAMVMFEQ